MNITNQTTDQLSSFYHALDLTTFILENYVCRVVTGLGIIFNMCLLRLLLNKRLTHTMYNYLWSRAFCNMIVCLFGLVYMDFPRQIISQLPYYRLIYQAYMITALIRTAFLASAVSDILLVLNRYFNILNKKNFLSEISKVANLLICYSIRYVDDNFLSIEISLKYRYLWAP